MADGTCEAGISMPRSRAARTRISATGSAPTSRSFSNWISAPMPRRISIAPARVGFTPTWAREISEPGAMLAATRKNAAEEMSAGTSISTARNRPPPSSETAPRSSRSTR